jgi:hypothetical protein
LIVYWYSLIFWLLGNWRLVIGLRLCFADLWLYLLLEIYWDVVLVSQILTKLLHSTLAYSRLSLHNLLAIIVVRIGHRLLSFILQLLLLLLLSLEHLLLLLLLLHYLYLLLVRERLLLVVILLIHHKRLNLRVRLIHRLTLHLLLVLLHSLRVSVWKQLAL